MHPTQVDNDEKNSCFFCVCLRTLHKQTLAIGWVRGQQFKAARWNVMIFLLFCLTEDDEFDTNRLATAPRPGTSLRTATAHDQKMGNSGGRPRTATGRPLTGMVSLSMLT